MLDRDLASLFQVETKTFNQAVKRNISRFPLDFMFQLTENEWEYLRSQIVTSNKGRGGIRYLPYVFSEQGVSMLSAILNSPFAIETSIPIMSTFVELRQTVTIKSNHTALQKDVQRIDLRMDTLEANHVIDDALVTKKVTQMSQEVHKMNQNFTYFSEVLNQFQQAHLIIKRPNEENFEGQ